MAAPAVQGTPTTNSSSSSFATIDVAKPTGTTAGETLVVYVKLQSTGAAPTSVSVSGFTPRGDSGTNGVRSRVFVLDRVVDGSEGATFTATPGSAPNRQIAIVCFRLAASGGVEFDAAIGGGLQGNGSAAALPDLTTNHADCFVGAFAGAYTGPVDASLSGYSTVADITWTGTALDRVWGKTQAVAGSAGTPTVSAAASNERIGLIVASWNEAAGGGGDDVTGTAASTITASASASGVRGVTGTASSTITASGTAGGIRGVTGTASSTITAAAAASGVRGRPGTAASTITAAASAAGAVAHTGAAASTVTASATATGTRAVTGSATSTITASASAEGVGQGGGTGAASSTITASATASGVRGVTGTAASTITATATATDGQGAPTGTASSTITASATASGVVGHEGVITSAIAASATATAVRGVTGSAASTITATATIIVGPVVYVPATARTYHVAAEPRTHTVAADRRTLTVGAP